MDYLKRTWAEIDLDAIAHNYAAIRAATRPHAKNLLCRQGGCLRARRADGGEGLRAPRRGLVRGFQPRGSHTAQAVRDYPADPHFRLYAAATLRWSWLRTGFRKA